jgi:hypothetical protein
VQRHSPTIRARPLIFPQTLSQAERSAAIEGTRYWALSGVLGGSRGGPSFNNSQRHCAILNIGLVNPRQVANTQRKTATTTALQLLDHHY